MSQQIPKVIIAFRHGRFPLNNRAGLKGEEALEAVEEGIPFDADTELGLLPEGEQQALAIPGYLGKMTVDACLTSPTRRARQTAELAMRGRVLLKDIVIVPELIERSRGIFSYAPDEWARQHPDYGVNKQSSLDWQPFGTDYNGKKGESIRDVMENRVPVVLDLAGQVAPGRTVALSAHGEWMLALRAKLLGFSDDRLRQPLLPNLPPEAIASREARWVGHGQVDIYELAETDNGLRATSFRTAVDGFDTGRLAVKSLLIK